MENEFTLSGAISIIFAQSNEDVANVTGWNYNTITSHKYRWLRNKFNILMDENSKPVGGKWNFDKENRQSISKLKSDIPNRNNIITFLFDHWHYEAIFF